MAQDVSHGTQNRLTVKGMANTLELTGVQHPINGAMSIKHVSQASTL